MPINPDIPALALAVGQDDFSDSLNMVASCRRATEDLRGMPERPHAPPPQTVQTPLTQAFEQF